MLQKVGWSLIADREDNSNRLNKTLLAFYRGIVLLHKENKAVFQINLDFIHEDHNTKVLAYSRWY
jgi:1,4-alpha-glucan branching enzyme